MVRLKVMLFGGFEARLGPGPRLALPTKKAQAVLAYLGLRPGQSHQRDQLAALLWGEKSDDLARGGLRHALVALRRGLGDAEPPFLHIEGQTVALDPARVEIDVVTFERLVAEGTPQALEQAAELYRGDLLLGLSVNESAFEEWLVVERERLREMALGALAKLLAHQSKEVGTERAIQTAVRLLGLDPLQEAVHRTLMRLYARQGRRGAALKQYQVCVGSLRRELGTELEAETRQLYQQLLRGPAAAAKPVDAPGHHHTDPPRKAEAPTPNLPAAETPLFGRQAELGRLRELLDQAVRGHGHMATVVGEAGIGKTRLVSAVVAETLSRRCRVLVGRCHESESILPFGPWVDACRSGQVSGDEEILGALHPTRRSELARLLPEASAPGRPPPSDSALPLFESVAELIELVALRQPVVLVLEDVHWADEMSLRLLAFVSRRLPAWRALLVASVRADELVGGSMAQRILEDLSRASRITPVVLSPLSRADTALLVRALARIGSDAQAVAKVAEQIWAMSEGNPFVTVEAMHALDQAGVWAGDGGAPGALALPASVRDLVARRLDGLSAPSQEVAAVAAVIGRQFGFTLLQSASGMDEGHAAHAVEEMVRHHLLQAVGNQLEFTHDRIRDVAAGRLLPARRRVLHRAVAEALEAGAGSFDGAAAFTQDHLSEQIEQLAHHCLRGELWEKAVHYLRQAGLRSAARSALPDARVRFEQALDVLEALPESPSNLEQAFEIRLELRPVLTQLGEVGRTLERLREAETLAERLDDDVRRGRVYAFLTNIRAMVGELDGALAAGTRALALAERLADVNLRILSTTYLEVTRYYRGEYEHVVTLATDALAALPGDRADEYLGMPAPPSVYDRSFLVLAMAELGRFSEAAAHEAEAMRRAELTQHAYTIGMACRTTAMLHLLKGDWPQALSRLERGIIALRTGNVPLPLPILLASSAWALAQVGEATEALNRLREGEQLLDRQAASGLVGQSGWVYQALGRVSLLLGRLDEAQQLGERALTSCPHHFGFVAHALHLLADIATHPDRADAASGEAHYDKALALAGARGMRPLVAHCHLGLGKLYARSARPRQARHAFTTATAMYREMGMRYWLEHARAERLARA